MEKPVGEIKFDRAAIVWKDMIKAIRMIDTDNKGKYSNNAGLSSKKLNRLDRNLSKTDYAQELFKLFDSKEIPPISERATNPLVDDYWTIINITQKMSFIQKSKDAIIADGDKFVSKYSIFEDIDKDIQDNQKRRRAFISKIKNKTLRTAVDFVFQKINDWYITPFMQWPHLDPGEHKRQPGPGLYLDFLGGQLYSTIKRGHHHSCKSNCTGRPRSAPGG